MALIDERRPLYMDYGPDWPPPAPQPVAPAAVRRRGGWVLLGKCAATVLVYALIFLGGLGLLAIRSAGTHHKLTRPPAARTIGPPPCSVALPCERDARPLPPRPR